VTTAMRDYGYAHCELKRGIRNEIQEDTVYLQWQQVP